MRRGIWVAGCLGPAGPALAHGYITYVSTPITPPAEFRWWLPVAIVILLASTVAVFRVALGCRWPSAAIRAAFGVALFAVSFYGYGQCAATASTAPPAGLGPPCPTYWGRGWSDSGGTFLLWNVIGAAFLAVSLSLSAGRRQRWKKRLGVASVGALAYALALTPYLARGAYVHGWAGGYVHIDCMRRLGRLTDAVCDYVDAHGGMLPAANDIDELAQVVRPYLDPANSRFTPGSAAVCPVGGAFERDPRKYFWDSRFSGRRITELGEDTLTLNGLISCPYHERHGADSVIRVMESLWAAESQPAAPSSGPQAETP